MSSSDKEYIDVAVALPVRETYTYEVPEEMAGAVVPGKRVFVPFGRRRVTGYVLGRTSFPENFSGRILPVAEVPDEKPVIPESMIPFYRWISDYYMHPLGETVKKALPEGMKLCKKNVGRHKTLRFVRPANISKRSENRLEGLSAAKKGILKALSEKGEIAVTELRKSVPSAPRLVKVMEKDSLVEIFEKRVYRDPFGEAILPDTPPVPTPEQRAVVERICDSLSQGFATWLLAGVTGSGKTEVYMRIVAETVKKGSAAIVLVPEIALISQMERRFRARFGECVGILHSGLSKGERYDQWMRIIDGGARIVIGARSAIFAPVERPGVIIVDEEHDSSYKDGTGFGYNAKDLAVIRAKLAGAVAVLGSATPSVQSFYNVFSKKYRVAYLNQRIEKRPLPHVDVVDLRTLKEERGIARLVTPALQKALARALERGEQAILFLNRRGFANLPVCDLCGTPLKCRHCDITLTLHKKADAYRCHLCGYVRPLGASCVQCGADRIIPLGFGTEKIEDALQKLFPKAGIARMDRDTVAKKGAILKILKGLRDRTVDILIGTQMVAKGHDFPNITLVGIICADISLNFPDFRAGERTFQLLAQVAGRAGRGEEPGRVILQTYNPEHFTILTAKNQDFKAFYDKEIEFRRALNYPPFSRLAQLRIEGEDIQKTRERALAAGDLCDALRLSRRNFKESVEILGPVEAPVARIASKYRWQILVKGKNAKVLHEYLQTLFFGNKKIFDSRGVRMTIDVDPYFMM